MSLIPKRIKNLWSVSEHGSAADNQLREALKDAGPNIPAPTEDLGDGKAEFIGEGTEADFKEQEKEDAGLKGIFGL